MRPYGSIGVGVLFSGVQLYCYFYRGRSGLNLALALYSLAVCFLIYLEWWKAGKPRW